MPGKYGELCLVCKEWQVLYDDGTGETAGLLSEDAGRSQGKSGEEGIDG